MPVRKLPRTISLASCKQRPSQAVLIQSRPVSGLESTPRKAREPLRCPNDGSRLVEVERSEIIIDACPECRGVWLDRGELDKILVRERQFASPDPDEDFFGEVEGRRSRDRKSETYDDHSPRKRKRRSLLEDLLDFD